jgi:hypothetical protein
VRWRRLDITGSDMCELTPLADGWSIEGVAEYGVGQIAARLRYRVEADRDWVTRRARVQGSAGPATIELDVERRSDGSWYINGEHAAELIGLADVDLGFTPATNLFPLRRLALQPGEAADAEAAWLDDSSWTFARLPQRYERRDARSYWYQAPTTGYEGMLVVNAEGFVQVYPGLWTGIDDEATSA